MKNLTFIFASIIVAGAVIVGALFLSPNKRADAQGGNLPFGGKFGTITDWCCDGTYLIKFESAANGMPDGTFQTSYSADAYANLFYMPMPTACGLGFVRSGGSCSTITSYCRKQKTPDYTLTMIATSQMGCQM